MINLPPPPGFVPSKDSKGVLRRTTKEERKIIADYISKNSCIAAQIEFNISNGLAFRCRNEFGVKRLRVGRQTEYTDADIKSWIEYLKTNPKTTHAARNFGCSQNTIVRRINEYKTRNGLL
jgi:hypothetical protein